VFEIVRTDRIAKYDKMYSKKYVSDVGAFIFIDANCTNTVTFEIRVIHYRPNDRVVGVTTYFVNETNLVSDWSPLPPC